MCSWLGDVPVVCPGSPSLFIWRGSLLQRNDKVAGPHLGGQNDATFPDQGAPTNKLSKEQTQRVSKGPHIDPEP